MNKWVKRFEEILSIPRPSGKEEKIAVHEVIKETIIKHRKIIYNEDCYDKKYLEIMEKNGIYEIKTMKKALDSIQRSIEMFERTNVLTEEEINARISILSEAYISSSMIDITQIIDMIEREILPVIINVISKEKKQSSIISLKLLDKRINEMTNWLDKLLFHLDELKEKKESIQKSNDLDEVDYAMEIMEKVRFYVDKFESVISQQEWPYPSYETIWNGHC